MKRFTATALALTLAFATACSSANPSFVEPDAEFTPDSTREIPRPDALDAGALDGGSDSTPSLDAMRQDTDAVALDLGTDDFLDGGSDSTPAPDTSSPDLTLTPDASSPDAEPTPDATPDPDATISECNVEATCSDPGLPIAYADVTPVTSVNLNAGQGGYLQDTVYDLYSVKVESQIALYGEALGRLTLVTALSTCGTFQARLRIDITSPLYMTSDQQGGGRWEVPGTYNGTATQVDQCGTVPFEVVSYTRSGNTLEVYARGNGSFPFKMHLTFKQTS